MRHTGCFVGNICGGDLINYTVVGGKEKTFYKIPAMGIKDFFSNPLRSFYFLWIPKSFVNSKTQAEFHSLIEPSRSMSHTEALTRLVPGRTAVCCYKGQLRNQWVTLHSILLDK